MYLDIALPNFSKQLLTYKNNQGKSLIGHRVRVPFGKSEKIGIVIRSSQSTAIQATIKPILEDLGPCLAKTDLDFLLSLASYYQISENEVLLSAIPKVVLEGQYLQKPGYYSYQGETLSWYQLLAKHPEKTLLKKLDNQEIAPQPLQSINYPELPNLTEDQEKILQGSDNIALIWGKTGSGKTEVYIHLIKRQLLANKQVLLLVPEISLIAQVVSKIQKRLGILPVSLHSQVPKKQKACRWFEAYLGNAKVIVGTRSALLYPIKNLGLIIVDEEHDGSYRQDHPWFFSARDAAILKAKYLNIPIVLGSATPSLESLLNAKRNKYALHFLEKRFNAKLPKLHMVNLPKDTFISPVIVPLVQACLEKDQHVLLYIGKRGYSRLIKCHACGYDMRCQGCDRLLVFHKDHHLKCHYCETKQDPITDCPNCHQAELSHYGAGSQRIEDLAKSLWPSFPTLRIDTDTMQAEKASQLLLSLHERPATIVIGTQMLTKGHDIEKLNTVVIVDADHGLYAQDFRAEEKLFSELIQISGRSGRRDIQGDVYIQTKHPNHAIFQHLNNPKPYYDYLLEQREDFSLPPYAYIACLYVRGSARSLTKLQSLTFPQKTGVSILGPSPFSPGKRKNQDCYQIMISSTSRSARNQLAFQIRHILEQALNKNTTIISQIDSHLSV